MNTRELKVIWIVSAPVAAIAGAFLLLSLFFMGGEPRIFGDRYPVPFATSATIYLLLAIIFVAAVSIGPTAGILALILFNIGVMAKLLSETVDGVDTGPIEAVDAGGSTRTQMVRWAVVPQVLPNYVAFSLYAFELNIRASTVIAQMNAVLAGSGIGVIPYFMARGEERLVPVLPELNIERGYWLQVNPDSQQIARVRATIDFIVSQIQTESDLFHTLPTNR